MSDKSAIRTILEQEYTGISDIQRRLHISHTRATALIEYLTAQGILEPVQCYRVNRLHNIPPDLPVKQIPHYLEQQIQTLENDWQSKQKTS